MWNKKYFFPETKIDEKYTLTEFKLTNINPYMGLFIQSLILVCFLTVNTFIEKILFWKKIVFFLFVMDRIVEKRKCCC